MPSDEQTAGGLQEYIDYRELVDTYERHVCPECGDEQWFNTRGDYATCVECRAYLHYQIEIPCPECGTRTELDTDMWTCNVCGHHEGACSDVLIDRLSSDDFMVPGKPGIMRGSCPVCSSKASVNGGPDGELECSECDFYAGQFSDKWYAYAVWMHRPERVRIVEEGL